MEPNNSTWFINYAAHQFRVTVRPGTNIPVGIELATGNENGQNDTFEKVVFPWITFYIYKAAHDSSKIAGAFNPSPTQ